MYIYTKYIYIMYTYKIYIYILKIWNTGSFRKQELRWRLPLVGDDDSWQHECAKCLEETEQNMGRILERKTELFLK